eukprot:Em0009g960a
MAQAWAVGTECIGKFNFPGSSHNDLPFKKGDKLVIVAPTKDPNWYKARRADGLEGMIPFNYVQEKVSPTVSHVQEKVSPTVSHVQEKVSPTVSHVQEKASPTPRRVQEKASPTPRRVQETVSPTVEKVSPTVSHAHEEKASPTVHGEVHLQAMPWFHGRISREDAEKLLTPPKNGQFLVRESQNYPGDYTLCVSYNGKVENYRVQRNEKDMVTVDGDDYFDDLIELVEHYHRGADGLCTRLKQPVAVAGPPPHVISRKDFEKQGWAIPRKELIKKAIIGKGEFGEVCLGEYNGTKVAMKSMKDVSDSKGLMQFLTEASVMTSLRHPNLVCLIGISLDDNPIYLITEYMAKGSLIDYLRSRGRAVITKQNQIDFARHVNKGMMYLESQNFIHRDLAARNVLISEENVAKVSDFGLAKSSFAAKQDSTKLPVKWTAPEALRDAKFSNKSDVWSFGVLLWEIYSYGRVPYPKVPVEEVAAHVESGYRMEPPEGCPDQINKIMTDCWNKDPNQRPTFAYIEKMLESVAKAS